MVTSCWSMSPVKFWDERVAWGTPKDRPGSLGERLVELRDAYTKEDGTTGLLLGEAAKLVGIGSTSLGNYERGDTIPIPKEQVRALANFYGVRADDLFEIEGAHMVWLNTQASLPGPSIAIPAEPVVKDIVSSLKVMAERYDDESGLAPVRIIMQAVQHMDKDSLEKAAKTLASILDNIDSEIPARDALAQDEDAG